MRTVSGCRTHSNRQFQQVVAGFLRPDGLAFADVLSAEHIEQTFERHGNLFGDNSIYSTALVLWAFLGQVLRDGRDGACQSAVASIVSFRLQCGLAAPTADTGDYCRARAKLCVPALRDLCTGVADELEQRADLQWLWKGRHVSLVDGFTFTMPDTAENQAEYPQTSSQAEGVGFPIARACVLLSLATACVRDLKFGPYAGKKTGETALLREMLDSLQAEDVLVADCYYCSFLMIALLVNRRVDVCATMHATRHVDFRRGRRLGKYDHLVTWHRPVRPEWMDEETYATIPETLTLREVRFNITEPGRRTDKLTVVTTLTDAEQYSREDIAMLYGFRWNAELDIRAIKQSLNLDHMRCKSPEMVRRELWTKLLAYNLIRTTAAAAALLHDRQPRQISFSGTCQYVVQAWNQLAVQSMHGGCPVDYCQAMLEHIAICIVADRPGRIEPRVIKRRRHRYPLMQKPRQQLRDELNSSNDASTQAL